MSISISIYLSIYLSIYIYIYIYIYTHTHTYTHTLKAYNKIRATNIISHSLPERRSIFDASHWLKLSNVTGCFTACIVA